MTAVEGEAAETTAETTPSFFENEKILCYQVNIIYEAKCLRIRRTGDDGALSYLVHYAGWNKNHDEWVPASRMLKHTPQNLKKQEECVHSVNINRSKRVKLGNGIKLQSARAAAATQVKNSNDCTAVAAAAGASSAATVAKNSSKVNKKNEKVEASDEPPAPDEKVDGPIQIPKQLKDLLVDDSWFVHENKMLFELPCGVTVEKMIDLYQRDMNKNTEVNREELKTMKEVFNVTLPSRLLHKFERPQLGDMIDKYPNKQPAEIYGFPHFLRFLSTVEASMERANIVELTRKNIRSYCQEIVDYMCRNSDSLYDAREYYYAPAEYHRRAMT